MTFRVVGSICFHPPCQFTCSGDGRGDVCARECLKQLLFQNTSEQLVGSHVVKRITQRGPEIEVGIKKLSWGCEGQRQGKQKEQIGWSCG